METTHSFTRPEIAEYLRPAFDRLDIVSRDDAVEILRERGAPEEMTRVIEARVPEGTVMRGLRSLWVYLRDVPMERAGS